MAYPFTIILVPPLIKICWHLRYYYSRQVPQNSTVCKSPRFLKKNGGATLHIDILGLKPAWNWSLMPLWIKHRPPKASSPCTWPSGDCGESHVKFTFSVWLISHENVRMHSLVYPPRPLKDISHIIISTWTDEESEALNYWLVDGSTQIVTWSSWHQSLQP